MAHDLDLEGYLRLPAPRSIHRLDPMAQRQFTTRKPAWAISMVWLIISLVPLAIGIISHGNTDTFGWVMAAGWSTAAVVIAAALFVLARREVIRGARLTTEGVAHRATVVEKVYVERQGRKRPGGWRIWAQVQVAGAQAQRHHIAASMDAAAAVETGSQVLLVVHTDFAQALWVLPDGLPVVRTVLGQKEHRQLIGDRWPG